MVIVQRFDEGNFKGALLGRRGAKLSIAWTLCRTRLYHIRTSFGGRRTGEGLYTTAETTLGRPIQCVQLVGQLWALVVINTH